MKYLTVNHYMGGCDISIRTPETFMLAYSIGYDIGSGEVTFESYNYSFVGPVTQTGGGGQTDTEHIGEEYILQKAFYKK